MKKIFIALTIALLLSTPRITHPRVLTKIAALIPISVVTFYAYQEHTYAKKNGSSNPGLHAVLTVPDLAAQGLIKAGCVMEGVGIGIMKVVKDARQELMEANKPTKKDTPAAATNTEAPQSMLKPTQAKTQAELKATSPAATPEQTSAPVTADSPNTESK